MKCWQSILVAGGGLLLPGAPLWAHPVRAIHLHSGEVVPLLVVVAGLAVFLLGRYRAHPSREG
jgi:hypothetical protein